MAPTKQDPDWWKNCVVYQIYPRSFQDSNGDGIGDIPGIISRLDYLQTLGVGIIWLSPVFKSPMRDNGYDISDYRNVAAQFGTLEEMEMLVAESAARNIRILMDLVVNHTSDQHDWFQESRSSRDSCFREYYIWRDPGPDGAAPNGMQSVFGGPAWTFDVQTEQYYFHQFAPEQPDLNWQNETLRSEVQTIIEFWLDRGIAGFRLDVIDLIAKEPDRGITANGPRLHDYLRELAENSFRGRSVLSVGEAWSATPETALLYSGRERRELSMVFQFEHVTQQWEDRLGKWQPKDFDLIALKRIFNKWQAALESDGWNSLFWGNHDLPRAVSKYGNDGKYRVQSAKMLATILHLMKGTPYIFQGEELGMTNIRFNELSDFRDIETLNYHDICIGNGMSEADFIAGANENGRDNARTPMQWEPGGTAGFTEGEPWIAVNPNAMRINAVACLADKDSIYWHYQNLIALRKKIEVIVHGRYEPILPEHPEIFAYRRVSESSAVVMIANFSGGPVTFDIPDSASVGGASISSNYTPRFSFQRRMTFLPYEAQAIICDSRR
ncbi:MAG: alpha-glucosidase [Alphaproteobacteria bacterium]|nr:alpha-glucosidase [Alphaproteobacteria bacterium]